MTYSAPHRKNWGVEGPALPQPVSAPVQTAALQKVRPWSAPLAAKKPCGGCGKGGPQRVARPQAAPSRAPNALDGHFNPSLIEWRGRLLLASRKGRTNSRLFITPLKDDLSPAGNPVSLKIEHSACKNGQEDPRFVIHDGKLLLSFLGVLMVGGRLSTFLMLADVRDDFSAANVRTVPYRDRVHPVEKNWVPFSDSDLKFVYSVEPHRVLAVRDGKAEQVGVSQPDFEWRWGRMRGGAAPVRVGDEFYHWFHGTGQQGGRPFYTAGLYTFSADGQHRVKRFIPEPLLEGDRPNDEGKRVVFPCGAILKDGKWIVSYGWNDVAVRFATFDATDIERRLVAVG